MAQVQSQTNGVVIAYILDKLGSFYSVFSGFPFEWKYVTVRGSMMQNQVLQDTVRSI